tara:strand:+ start:550 stop:1308 length:759 start_codon:yes stop_codon:yes gene_type:complete
MRNYLLSGLLLISTAFVSQAESDTTRYQIKSGMALYGEFGVLGNNSFDAIRDKMRALNIQPFESLMASIVFAKRYEGDKWFLENRLILMNSTNYTTGKNEVKGYFGGIGIGVDAGPKLLNTKHWNIILPIGYDLMLYRLMVKNNRTASLGQVVQNPGAFEATKLRTGNINVHGGVGVDYKINIKKGFTEKIYISTKVSYHLPLFQKNNWKGSDVTVSDLPHFKPNQLYFQLGIVAFPRKQENHSKYFRHMHQ